MTFSIVARCPRTDQIGVAACTATLGVGKLVCWANSNAGAIATQAFVNPYYGIDGVRLLGEGYSADQVLQQLLANDPSPHQRQVGIIDREGRTVAWEGSACLNWAGHLQGENFCCQGNRLTGAETLEAMGRAFTDHADKDLAERLLLALDAGEGEGGDRHGSRSANVYVFATEEYPLWDMRVDDAPNPVKEMHRLHKRFAENLVPYIKKLPTRRHRAGEKMNIEGGIG